MCTTSDKGNFIIFAFGIYGTNKVDMSFHEFIEIRRNVIWEVLAKVADVLIEDFKLGVSSVCMCVRGGTGGNKCDRSDFNSVVKDGDKIFMWAIKLYSVFYYLWYSFMYFERLFF